MTKITPSEAVTRAMQALGRNNIEAFYATDKEHLLEIVDGLLPEGCLAAFGGSMTLYETGLIDYLRGGRVNLLDRDKAGLAPAEVQKVFRDSFWADAYFMSSNAVTEEGELYNIDGNGNRVAALCFGPAQVIVVVGENKLVANLDEAIQRTRAVAAPKNAKRLGVNTGCIKTGRCIDCHTPQRICRSYVRTAFQANPDRIKVIFVAGSWGY